MDLVKHQNLERLYENDQVSIPVAYQCRVRTC